MAAVTITHFTDPMMGLSWELEPALRKVETHFGSQVLICPAMGLLLRDVADFMTPQERALTPAEGLARYNARLAQIYLQEEPLAGMPINMERFALFAPNRRTSLPLCLAYAAVAATWPRLAERFLYRLRYATVVECRATTKLEELVRVARLCGIDANGFLAAYHGSAAQDRLYQDLSLKEQRGIYGLPAFVVSCEDQRVLLQGVPTYEQFRQAILQVSGGAVQPQDPVASSEALQALLDVHPLISYCEIAASLNTSAVEHLAAPLVAHGTARRVDAPKGHFLAAASA